MAYADSDEVDEANNSATNVFDLQEVTLDLPVDYVPKDPWEGGTFMVAYYHTHTPFAHCCDPNIREPRGTGPSGQDTILANLGNYPEIVVDYTDSIISACHPKDAPYTLYPYGPERRFPPIFEF